MMTDNFAYSELRVTMLPVSFIFWLKCFLEVLGIVVATSVYCCFCSVILPETLRNLNSGRHLCCKHYMAVHFTARHIKIHLIASSHFSAGLMEHWTLAALSTSLKVISTRSFEELWACLVGGSVFAFQSQGHGFEPHSGCWQIGGRTQITMTHCLS